MISEILTPYSSAMSPLTEDPKSGSYICRSVLFSTSEKSTSSWGGLFSSQLQADARHSAMGITTYTYAKIKGTPRPTATASKGITANGLQQHRPPITRYHRGNDESTNASSHGYSSFPDLIFRFQSTMDLQ